MTSTVKARYSTPSSAVRIFGQIVSIIFHPLLIGTYVISFLLFIHPMAFAGVDHQIKIFRFLHVLLSTAVMPAFAVFLLWRLNFSASLYLDTPRERIIPYVITMFFYWWTWNVFHHLNDSAPAATHFFLGAFLAICVGWICNIFFKISMHALAVGGLFMFAIIFCLHDNYASGLYISIALLITGLVCTARLLVSDHHEIEIYAGLIAGALAQWIAWQF